MLFEQTRFLSPKPCVNLLEEDAIIVGSRYWTKFIFRHLLAHERPVSTPLVSRLRVVGRTDLTQLNKAEFNTHLLNK